MLRHLVIAVAVLGVSTGCVHSRAKGAAPSTPHVVSSMPAVKGKTLTSFALRHIDVAVGTGAELKPRTCVYAHYTGWLVNGLKFDSSRDTMPNGKPRTPISFPQGSRRVIAGWDLGFEGMRVGGKRRLFIPYQLGYGEAGRLPTIPTKSELVFDVELMAVADTLPRAEPVPRGQTAVPQCPAWEVVGK